MRQSVDARSHHNNPLEQRVLRQAGRELVLRPELRLAVHDHQRRYRGVRPPPFQRPPESLPLPAQRYPQNPVGADGRMALADHLRELRARLLRVVLVLVVAVVVALFFYDQLLALVYDPYKQAAGSSSTPAPSTIATINGVGGPLLLQLKLCGVAAVVADQPLLALPDLGVHRPGPAPQRAALDPAVRRRRRPAVHRRRRASATTCCPRASRC